MKDVITIRLAAETRKALKDEAQRLGIPSRTFLRKIAEECATQSRRRQIKEQGKAFVARLKSKKPGREFFEDWGTPSATKPE